MAKKQKEARHIHGCRLTARVQNVKARIFPDTECADGQAIIAELQDILDLVAKGEKERPAGLADSNTINYHGISVRGGLAVVSILDGKQPHYIRRIPRNIIDANVTYRCEWCRESWVASFADGSDTCPACGRLNAGQVKEVADIGSDIGTPVEKPVEAKTDIPEPVSEPVPATEVTLEVTPEANTEVEMTVSKPEDKPKPKRRKRGKKLKRVPRKKANVDKLKKDKKDA